MRQRTVVLEEKPYKAGRQWSRFCSAMMIEARARTHVERKRKKRRGKMKINDDNNDDNNNSTELLVGRSYASLWESD